MKLLLITVALAAISVSAMSSAAGNHHHNRELSPHPRRYHPYSNHLPQRHDQGHPPSAPQGRGWNLPPLREYLAHLDRLEGDLGAPQVHPQGQPQPQYYATSHPRVQPLPQYYAGSHQQHQGPVEPSRQVDASHSPVASAPAQRYPQAPDQQQVHDHLPPKPPVTAPKRGAKSIMGHHDAARHAELAESWKVALADHKYGVKLAQRVVSELHSLHRNPNLDVWCWERARIRWPNAVNFAEGKVRAHTGSTATMSSKKFCQSKLSVMDSQGLAKERIEEAEAVLRKLRVTVPHRDD